MLRPWIAGSLVAAALLGALPSAATARTSKATLSVRISAVTKGTPQVGKFFTVRVNVLNQGPDAFPGGLLVLKLSNAVSDYEITRRREVRSCKLREYPAASGVRAVAECVLEKLGRFDSAELRVRLRVPRALGGKLLRIYAGAVGEGAKSADGLYERPVPKPKPRPVRPGGPWHGDWKVVATEDPPPKGNGTTFAPAGVFSITQKGTRLCATYPWNPFPGGRLGTSLAALTSPRALEAGWTSVDGAGTTVWDSRLTADGMKITGRYVFTPRSGGRPIEGRTDATKFDGQPLRIPPGC